MTGTWLDGTTTPRPNKSFERVTLYPEQYGAVGDGVTNDYAALVAVLAACGSTYALELRPGKTYLCSTRIQVPANLIIKGNGAWIKGGVSFDSGDRVYNLKFGDVGTWNGFNNNADDVGFVNCDATGGDAAACINFTGGKATNIRYVGGSISGNVSGGNGVALLDHATTLQHYEDIGFYRVKFHHNDRMNFEAIVRGNGVDPVTNGYRNIKLVNCTMDPTDPRGIGSININVSFDSIMLTDGSGRSGGYSTVKGCTITGGAYCLESAGAIEMLIKGNTLKDSTLQLLSMSQQSYNDACNSRIIGNRFSGTTDVVVSGRGNIFTGNRYNGAGRVQLSNASYTSFTSNNIETTGFEAVMVAHSPYNLIKGNHIRGGVSQSILFQYVETVDNYVDGNFFYQVGALYTILNGTTQHFGRNMRVLSGVAYDSEAGGVSTSTPGAVTTLNIPHGLGVVPTRFGVQPGDVNARGAPAYFVTATSTNVVLTFASALAAATAYTWNWTAKV